MRLINNLRLGNLKGIALYEETRIISKTNHGKEDSFQRGSGISIEWADN